MKLTDLIVNKFGSDKVMHFFGGALITALLSPFGWFGILIGFIITLILSFIKEQYLDVTFEWGDIIAAICGSSLSTVIYAIIFTIL